MLTPEYLQRITEGAEEISSSLHRNIMNMIIERVMNRIARGEDYLLTQTDKWQIKVLQESGELLADIQKEIADKTKKQTKEIQDAFRDAGIKALEWDDAIYRAAGLSPTPLLQSPMMLRILERDYLATAGEWNNFCRTTAEESQRVFINAMDNAYHLVSTGAVSYTQAVRDVINNITEVGLKVNYPTGYRMSIESATMMIVRTGVGQAAADISLKRMEEMEWDTVLVSAHLGARTGNGGMNPGNHLWWQGRFYSRTGKDKRFPDFVKTTGFGTGEGLCGWNCRHSFGSGDGVNNPYEDKKITLADNHRVEELQKKQRAQERRIRDKKRKIQNLQTAVDNCKDDKARFELQNMLDRKAHTLKLQNKRYSAFCEENDLREYAERLKVAKWDRQQAMKTAGAARRYENIKNMGTKKM
nr:MAG TPA: minor capsid protein [Caudoviricetes sp.]